MIGKRLRILRSLFPGCCGLRFLFPGCCGLGILFCGRCCLLSFYAFFLAGCCFLCRIFTDGLVISGFWIVLTGIAWCFNPVTFFSGDCGLPFLRSLVRNS